MKVYVESVWGEKFRIDCRGSHEFIAGTVWGRKQSTEALNLLEHVYHVKRDSVRFIFHGRRLS